MKIMGRQIPTDVLYPRVTLAVLEEIKQWLADCTRDDHSSDSFYRILDEMATNQPFDPAKEMVRDTSEASPLLPVCDGFQYRRPVWGLIAEEVEKFGILSSSSIQVKAEWLKQELLYCLRYVEYETVLAQFRTAVLALKLEFLEDYEGPLSETDVVVQGGFKTRGKRAKENIQKLVDGLIPALTKHIRDTSPRPADS